MLKPPSYPWVYTANDTSPNLDFWVKNEDGNIDLTGYTITFRMQHRNGSILEKQAEEISYIEGKGQIVFVEGDLVAGEKQRCELEFESSNGVRITCPMFFIDVRAELG